MEALVSERPVNNVSNLISLYVIGTSFRLEATVARKVLIGILGLAFLVECLFPLGGFFLPETALGLFKVGVTPDTLFLGYVSTWCLLFVAIICGLALHWVLKNETAGWTLSYILGAWWIGIGSALYFVYGRVDNLFLDALKGAIILGSAVASRGDTRPT